jgi:hypothetical protein
VSPIPGYEILDELGRGGMGIVYKARHLKLKRLVALKMIRAGAEAGPEELARFKTEAEAVARLQHPNIIQIYEVGEHDGRPFFSLEYVEGGSLAKQLTDTAISARQAAELVRTLAEAMDAAHQRGIVHRDLKPANILLQKSDPSHSSPGLTSGVPKIGDFGLAKQVGEDSGQTRSGMIMGTPSYMAPEQARGDTREVGPACDIWALGAILYELLTGRPPFRGATPLETLEQVCRQDPVPPRRLQPRVQRDLETICLKCLHKELGQRYAGAREVADDLRRFLDHEPIHARPVGLGERSVKWVRRRPALTLAALLAVCTLSAAGGGYWLWRSGQEARQQRESDRLAQEEREREHIDFFVGFDRHQGEPKGVGVVRPEDVSHRGYSLRFHSRNGVVERIDVVNGRGELTTAHPITTLVEQRSPGPRRECSFHFKRDRQGRLSSEVAYDRRGQVVWSLNYTPGETTLASWLDARGRPLARSGSGVSHVRFVYDPEEGYEREVWFLDGSQRLRPNDNDVHALRMDYDERGRVRQVTYLGLDGRPHMGKDGSAGYRVSYDEQDRETETALLDAAGAPVRGKDGYHKVTARYDEFGNQIEWAYWDVQDQPVRHRSSYHKIRSRPNENGEPVEFTYLGIDNRPTGATGGIATFKWDYDAQGNRSEEAYLDADGRRTAGANGVSRWTAAYDKYGLMTRQAFFDTQDRPLTLPDGSHSWIAEYNDRGLMTAKAFFDSKDSAVLTKEGIHRWKAAFDADGRQTEAAYFGPEDRPIAPRDGVARWKLSFDESGRLKERTYFGVDNRPVKVPDGYAVEQHLYDQQGMSEVISYFDEQLQPTRHREGYHKVGSMWAQALGMTVQVFMYLDANNNPTVTRDGYGRMAVVRDGRGNITQALYMDKDGGFTNLNGQMEIKIVHRDGIAGWKASYDDQNHQTEIAYIGSRGEPVYHRAGYARITRTFDAGGKQTSETRCILDKAGAYCRARERRNSRGQVVEWAYFTDGDRPTLHADGYHIQRNRYDDQGRCVEVTYFDKDEKPSQHAYGNHKLAIRHDEKGREIEKRYYGPDGKPTPGRDGFARWTAKYNDRGQRVEEAHFGPNDEPVVARVGHARATWKYDKASRVIEQSFWVLDAQGAYVLQRTLDGQGRTLEYAFFDSRGKPGTADNGIHRFKARYDAAGHRIEEVYFDSAGQPAMRPDGPVGYHAWTRKYDERGRETEMAFFGLRREPVLHRDGYHRRTTGYNARGQDVETAYFGTDNKPILSAEGFARVTKLYDEKGNRKEFSYFGVDGKPVRTPDGLVKLQWIRNAGGAEVAMAAFDEKDRPLSLRTQILQVKPGGVGERGGLKAGDVILTYDGKVVGDYVQFLRLAGTEHVAGTPQKLTVLRSGKTLSLTLPSGDLGLTLKPLVLPRKD